MIINDKRALAYIVTVDEIKPIPNYDRVEHARVNGWWCIIKLGELKVGDKAIYFEIDSKAPQDDERFNFLEKYHYKIKTQKMCKVFSQGLLMPVTMFPEVEDLDVGSDVTDILNIKYSVAADNKRKANNDPNSKYKSMIHRHKRIFSRPIIRKIMRYSWGRKIMFFFFGKRKDKKLSFPTHFKYVHRTDEERCENIPWVLGYKNPLIVTEKLDGTSTTYILEKKKENKFEFYVLSRNVRQMSIEQKTYHKYNIYWEMALKYDIEKKLKDYLKEHKELKYVCIQGESVGKVQGNPLNLKEDDIYIYNFIRSDTGRLSSIEGKKIIESWGMKFVPVLDTNYYMPSDMEEFKKFATAKSAVNPDVLREGIVLRDPTCNLSFKNVSREYLLKHEDQEDEDLIENEEENDF